VLAHRARWTTFGNIAPDVTVHYRVVAYTFIGFGPPLGTGVAVKGGSTAPARARTTVRRHDPAKLVSSPRSPVLSLAYLRLPSATSALHQIRKEIFLHGDSSHTVASGHDHQAQQ
jgi:hypothetical protein